MTGIVCKWCGTRAHSRIGGVYLCGSSSLAGEWRQSDTCQQRSVESRADLEGLVEILKVRLENEARLKEILRQRLADALAALTAIERHEAGSDLGFEKISDHGEWVLFEDLQLVVDILQGKDLRESEDEQ